MSWEGWLSVMVVLGVLLSLALTRVGPHMITMAALTVLSISGVLAPAEALSGFANPGLITVAAMFVVVSGIHGSGGIEILVNRFLGRPQSERGALTRMFPPLVLLSGFLNNTPVVATMIPAVHNWARKINIAPSKLMIPLSYASILGGTLTLIGTSTNLVVNGQYQALTGDPGFSLFSITAVGLPITLIGVAYMWLVFPRSLPDRTQEQPFGNQREFTLEVSVATGGPLVGKTVETAGLRNLRRIYLVEIVREDAVITAVPSEEKLKGGDRLIFAGETEAISDLLRIHGIVASPERGQDELLLKDTSERRLVEAVVSPHCAAIGEAIRDARFRDRYGAAILAVARNGERVKGHLGTITIEAGDTLLLESRPAFVTRQRYNKDFLLINELESTPPRHDRAYIAWGILILVVALAAFGITSMLNASLLGAGLMLITRCCSIWQAEKSLDLTVLITIAASLALGAALDKTGAADLLAAGIIDLSGATPWLMLVLTYLCVSILTELITNNAAAIVMLPIVLEITDKMALNPEPFIFAIMIGASASFATPLGYQTNLMVYGPGNYRFTDFLKAGLPMNLLIGVSTLAILLLGWPLQA
ncbi:MAG: SLC13 family permease [Proteobacteria bacterium]|nr:SLC13 family permease [Pseudomonadota bacterium]MDA1301427.1 SLC13 family permease [Pseudomonadota bacterium]